jgi:hypothetical protein
MSVIRVGGTSRYADGWSAIFGDGPKPGGRKSKKATKTKRTSSVAKKGVKKGSKKAATKAGRKR